MANAYITFERASADEDYVYAGVTASATGIPGFAELGVWLAFPGEPSASTIRSTLITYALSEIESATGVNIPQGQIVLIGAPT